ncbi:hypothetical protein Unana1_04791 [Umbelopsis nana]
MAFRFNFSNPDSDNESESENPSHQLDSAIQAISLEQDTSHRIKAEKCNIMAMKLPDTLQADRVRMPLIDFTMYKRTLSDVKFQIARQDTLDVDQTPMIEMAGNTDLIKGIYEGGFKTWECSIDLVEFMHTKMADSDVCNKKILELGCGSALPGIYLLMRHESNMVDFQDYNEQVLQFITIPNIILNTVVTPTQPEIEAEAEAEPEAEPEAETKAETTADQDAQEPEIEAEAEDDADNDEDEDDDEPHADEEELDHADAELEIPEHQVVDILSKVSQKSQCFMGEWQSLPDVLNHSYDMIVTSETVYSEESIPGLVKVLQNTLRKPDGVAYVAAKDKDNHKFKYETVFETSGKNTVKREILKVTWDV